MTTDIKRRNDIDWPRYTRSHTSVK